LVNDDFHEAVNPDGAQELLNKYGKAASPAANS